MRYFGGCLHRKIELNLLIEILEIRMQMVSDTLFRLLLLQRSAVTRGAYFHPTTSLSDKLPLNIIKNNRKISLREQSVSD